MNYHFIAFVVGFDKSSAYINLNWILVKYLRYHFTAFALGIDESSAGGQLISEGI